MLKNSSLLRIALLKLKITHSEDKFISSGLCEGPGVCLYVIWAMSWEGPLPISPDFMRSLRTGTVFGCTATPCSTSLTQVLHLVIVWLWHSGFAFNSLGLLFRKILPLDWEKKVLNPACIWHNCFQQNQLNYLCSIGSRNSLKHGSKNMCVFICWDLSIFRHRQRDY